MHDKKDGLIEVVDNTTVSTLEQMVRDKVQQWLSEIDDLAAVAGYRQALELYWSSARTLHDHISAAVTAHGGSVVERYVEGRGEDEGSEES